LANLASGKHPSTIAVLDLGSNTVLLLVLQRDGGVRLEEARITRLGEGVFESGRLAPTARARTREAVVEFAGRARDAGAQQVVAVGTEALRRAEDGPAFLKELADSVPLDGARLLTGSEEARFAIEASRRSLGLAGDSLAVIDVGGGSTELAWLAAGGEVEGRSLPLGSVRLTEALVSAHPIVPAELDALRRCVRQQLGALREAQSEGLSGEGTLVAVAGTATTLAALEQRLQPYDPERVEGVTLARERIGAWVARLAALSLDARRVLPGLEPGRADVIVAGAIILEEILAALGADRVRVSGRGVRHGVALALLEGSTAV
jgi:exopolyphosphatase/guanosine-5'-triphosphate,3'-diphosphate pyrophosphatase